MSLWNLITGRQQHTHSSNWEDTIACFTGKYIETMSGSVGTIHVPVRQYEITYYADGELIHNRYSFFPAPDPDQEELQNMSMAIRYKKSRPHRYEVILDENEE